MVEELLLICTLTFYLDIAVGRLATVYFGCTLRSSAG